MVSIEFNADSFSSKELTSNLFSSKENDIITRYDRPRSQSFQEMMRENAHGVARIPSPNSHHKNHHRHHDHHHRDEGRDIHHHHSKHHRRHRSHSKSRVAHDDFKRTNSSPIERWSIKDAESAPSKPFLSLDEPYMSRSRSSSDSRINSKSRHFKAKDFTNENKTKTASFSSNPSENQSSVLPSHNEIKSARNGSFSSSPKEITLTVPVTNSKSASPKDIKLTPPLPELTQECLVKNLKNGLDLNLLDHEIKEVGTKKNIDPEVVDKTKTLKLIENLIKQIEMNYLDIEKQINAVFSKIYSAIESRKETLIAKAQRIRDRKLDSLLQSKKKSQNCCKNISREDSISDSENPENEYPVNGYHRARRSSVDDHDDILQENKILEPWKSGDKDKPATSVINDARNVKDLPNDMFSEILEEGNLMFLHDEEFFEMFSKIGEIKEGLSSPQLSIIKGLWKGFSVVGEEIMLEIHTRNRNDEPVFSTNDNIEVNVIDPNDEKLRVSMKSLFPRNRVRNSRRGSSVKVRNARFNPIIDGIHLIEIKVNHIPMQGSPFKHHVCPKMNLTFDHRLKHEESFSADLLGECIELKAKGYQCPVECMTECVEVRGVKCPIKKNLVQQQSEENDSLDSDWIFQKGDKSSLLSASSDIPSYIFAATKVSGLCSWKLRVSSACTNITFSIGVATRSGIPDIDEYFSCTFLLNCSLGMSKGPLVGIGGKTQARRTSTFNRLMQTYSVLLDTNEGFIRVVSEESEEDKKTAIDLRILQKFNLYPFCSMIHHHENCEKQVCPRPQITLI